MAYSSTLSPAIKPIMTTVATTEARNLQRELADKISTHAPLDEIRILLASGAQVNEEVVHGLKPLHYAVYGNNMEVVRMLLVRGADINAVDDVGYSALHLCAEHGNQEMSEYLINHNAQVSFVDEGETAQFPRAAKSEEPLRLAIKNHHYQLAELLLQNGADANARYFLGPEISMLSQTEADFLHLLLMYGCDPNVYDRDGLTPLMRACRHRDSLESVKILMDFGAFVNAVALEKEDFRTPLHYAILSGSVKTVRFLLQNGANVNMSEDYEKPSPLDIAVLRDSVELVHMLLEAGANTNAVHTYIGSGLHLACCSDLRNQYEIVELLLRYGADPNLTPAFEEGMLKSPTVEYFRSRVNYSLPVVQLLLAHGAEIVMQSPLRSPKGMLRNMMKIHQSEEIFSLLVDLGEKFSVDAIEKLSLPEGPRQQLVWAATQPSSLTQLCRRTIRSTLKPLKPEKVRQLPLPKFLQAYVLCDFTSNLTNEISDLIFGH